MNENGGLCTHGLLSFPKTRKRMKVIYTIRVKKENINELSKLDAVERIFNNEKGRMVVLLKQDFTDGKREVAENDYIGKMENTRGSELLRSIIFSKRQARRENNGYKTGNEQKGPVRRD